MKKQNDEVISDSAAVHSGRAAVTFDPPLQDIKQTARTIGCSVYFLRQLDKTGKLPAVRSGKKLLVNVGLLWDRLNAASQEGTVHNG